MENTFKAAVRREQEGLVGSWTTSDNDAELFSRAEEDIVWGSTAEEIEAELEARYPQRVRQQVSYSGYYWRVEPEGLVSFLTPGGDAGRLTNKRADKLLTLLETEDRLLVRIKGYEESVQAHV